MGVGVAKVASPPRPSTTTIYLTILDLTAEKKVIWQDSKKMGFFLLYEKIVI